MLSGGPETAPLPPIVPAGGRKAAARAGRAAAEERSILRDAGKLVTHDQDPLTGVQRANVVGRRALSISASRPVLADGAVDAVGPGDVASLHRYQEQALRALFREEDMDHALRAAVGTKRVAERQWQRAENQTEAWRLEAERLLGVAERAEVRRRRAREAAERGAMRAEECEERVRMTLRAEAAKVAAAREEERAQKRRELAAAAAAAVAALAAARAAKDEERAAALAAMAGAFELEREVFRERLREAARDKERALEQQARTLRAAAEAMQAEALAAAREAAERKAATLLEAQRQALQALLDEARDALDAALPLGVSSSSRCRYVTDVAALEEYQVRCCGAGMGVADVTQPQLDVPAALRELEQARRLLATVRSAQFMKPVRIARSPALAAEARPRLLPPDLADMMLALQRFYRRQLGAGHVVVGGGGVGAGGGGVGGVGGVGGAFDAEHAQLAIASSAAAAAAAAGEGEGEGEGEGGAGALLRGLSVAECAEVGGWKLRDYAAWLLDEHGAPTAEEAAAEAAEAAEAGELADARATAAASAERECWRRAARRLRSNLAAAQSERGGAALLGSLQRGAKGAMGSVDQSLREALAAHDGAAAAGEGEESGGGALRRHLGDWSPAWATVRGKRVQARVPTLPSLKPPAGAPAVAQPVPRCFAGSKLHLAGGSLAPRRLRFERRHALAALPAEAAEVLAAVRALVLEDERAHRRGERPRPTAPTLLPRLVLLDALPPLSARRASYGDYLEAVAWLVDRPFHAKLGKLFGKRYVPAPVKQRSRADAAAAAAAAAGAANPPHERLVLDYCRGRVLCDSPAELAAAAAQLEALGRHGAKAPPSAAKGGEGGGAAAVAGWDAELSPVQRLNRFFGEDAGATEALARGSEGGYTLPNVTVHLRFDTTVEVAGALGGAPGGEGSHGIPLSMVCEVQLVLRSMAQVEANTEVFARMARAAEATELFDFEPLWNMAAMASYSKWFEALGPELQEDTEHPDMRETGDVVYQL